MPKKKVILFIAFIIGLTILWHTSSINTTIISMITYNINIIKNFTQRHFSIAFLSFVLIYIASTFLMIPISAAMTILAGILFDFFYGVLAVTIGANLGAIIYFISIRYLIKNKHQKEISRSKQTVLSHIDKWGLWYIFLLRLVPIMPFNVVNTLGAFSTITLWEFILTTALGIMPASIAYIYAGEKIYDSNSQQEVFFILLLLSCISLILLICGTMLKKYIKSHKNA